MIVKITLVLMSMMLATHASAQAVRKPLFVCSNPKGQSYYNTDSQKGWVTDGFTAMVAIYADDIVILREEQEPFSTKDDGAEIIALNNLNKRTGGAMIAAWPGGAVMETYRIVPDGDQFEFYMTQSKHSPMGNGIDKVSAYSGPCVAYDE